MNYTLKSKDIHVHLLIYGLELNEHVGLFSSMEFYFIFLSLQHNHNSQWLVCLQSKAFNFFNIRSSGLLQSIRMEDISNGSETT